MVNYSTKKTFSESCDTVDFGCCLLLYMHLLWVPDDWENISCLSQMVVKLIAFDYQQSPYLHIQTWLHLDWCNSCIQPPLMRDEYVWVCSMSRNNCGLVLCHPFSGTRARLGDSLTRGGFWPAEEGCEKQTNATLCPSWRRRRGLPKASCFCADSHQNASCTQKYLLDFFFF